MGACGGAGARWCWDYVGLWIVLVVSIAMVLCDAACGHGDIVPAWWVLAVGLVLASCGHGDIVPAWWVCYGAGWANYLAM
ncbi:MAG: hypothetical protein GYA50_08060 [Eubacteriaceae bacterium]|nr:hypothetical protein [Eubacteriaceae bacterium]